MELALPWDVSSAAKHLKVSRVTPHGVKLSIDLEAVCLDASIMRFEPCNHRRMGGLEYIIDSWLEKERAEGIETERKVTIRRSRNTTPSTISLRERWDRYDLYNNYTHYKYLHNMHPARTYPKPRSTFYSAAVPEVYFTPFRFLNKFPHISLLCRLFFSSFVFQHMR